ncbi:flippase [Flammeovirga agarivorans]|uniref:Flippase n=1 Tax=Flammeovirga agarivorans TaxID=2726742 RepID=A0A7X8SMU6_9BACT|nr:flippase [Flammeovirga agarivorans]NLR93085.1 flippase [Flammeovirga agarivorans]
MNKYLVLIFHLLSGRILKLSANFFIGIAIARSLGPEFFGEYSYLLTFSTVVLPIIDFGLNGVLQKKITEEENILLQYELIKYASIVKSIVGVILFCFFIVLGYLTLIDKEFYWGYFFILLTFLFRSDTVAQIYLTSYHKGKELSIIQVTSFLISLVLKLVGVYKSLSVNYFCFAFLSEYILLFIISWIVINKYLKVGNIIKVKLDISKYLPIIKLSFPLILSSFAGMINLKIDVFLIDYFLTAKDVGVYSVATRFSEVWYVIPSTLSLALYELIAKLKNKGQLQVFYDVFTLLSLLPIIIVLLTSKIFITFLFGDPYVEAANILNVHIISLLFIFWGAILSREIIILEKTKFSLIRHLFGAVINIVLNIILIPRYGLLMTAYSTLVSYFCSNVLICFFYKSFRSSAFMMLKSFFFGIRMKKNIKVILYEKNNN